MVRQGGIRSEMNTSEGQQEWCKRPRKLPKKLLKWYGHVRRMKEEHIVRRMLDVNIPGKRRRGRPNLRWKDTCKRDKGFYKDDSVAKWLAPQGLVAFGTNVVG